MKTIKSSLWKRWLIHSLLICIVINIASAIDYWYFKYVLKISFKSNDSRYLSEWGLWDRFISVNYYQATPLLILAIMLLIEINARYSFPKKSWLFVTCSLLTGIAGTLVLLIYNLLLRRHFFFLLETPLLLSAYAFVYPLTLEFLYKRIFKAERLYQQSRAEINALKAQVHPHFLFNSLNSLYGTAITENATRTSAGIAQLSNLMRYVINESAEDFVPVINELDFIKEYIELQRLRLPDVSNEHVTININYDDDQVLIAPLLLIPFIENSFKYGLSVDHKSHINLHLSVARGELNMILENSIIQTSGGSGTGIENATRRLTLLYPGKHALNISRENQQFTVHLRIVLQ